MDEWTTRWMYDSDMKTRKENKDGVDEGKKRNLERNKTIIIKGIKVSGRTLKQIGGDFKGSLEMHFIQ